MSTVGKAFQVGCGGTILVVLLLVAGFCALGPSEEETRERYRQPVAEQMVKDELASRMKDPSSVQWQGIVSAESDSVFYVCGEFNARNSFGAYTGFESFAGRRGDVITEKGAAGTSAEARFNQYRTKCLGR